ncbi:jg10229, partial [Pararge aegeria aegeria]
AYDVRFTTRIQNVFMFTKISALVIIIIGGIVWMAGGFLTYLNAYDVRFTTRIQNVFMFTKISALVIIIIGGIVWMAGGNLQITRCV